MSTGTLSSSITTSARLAPAAMRAAVVAAPGELRLVTVPVPTPAPHQVRVKIEGCGVCASSLPSWQGRPWFSYPMPPGHLGHEAWGTVDAVGEAAEGFAVGDRVAFLGNSGYAEYDVVDAANAIALPPELDRQPFPAEPLGCAVNIFRRCQIRAGHTVAILGIGFLGALITTMAKETGAKVIALSRRRESIDLARRLGADHVVELGDRNAAIQGVAELTSGSGGYDVHGFCDVVVECTGEPEPLDIAGEISGVRGRLVIAGYHQDGPRTINLQLWNWRGLDVINAHERDPRRYIDGMKAAARMAAAGHLRFQNLITHRFPLEQLGAAFNAAVERANGFVKAIVTM